MTFCLKLVQTKCHCVFMSFGMLEGQKREKNRITYAVFGIKFHSIGKERKISK